MTDELSNSLRRFFDIPVVKPAKTPTQLYSYLDESVPLTARSETNGLRLSPRSRSWSGRRTATASRSSHIRSGSYSMSTYDSQLSKPERFANPSQVISTSDENFMIDPESVSQHKKNPIQYQKLQSDIVEATLKLGLTQDQQHKVQKYLNENQHENWDTSQTIDPPTRRILHKCDVIRAHQQKLENQSKCDHVKRQWLVTKTHPKGIIGIDTPLFQNQTQTKFYGDIIRNRRKKSLAKKQILQLRRSVINHNMSINSGLLYHCPEIFVHSMYFFLVTDIDNKNLMLVSVINSHNLIILCFCV